MQSILSSSKAMQKGFLKNIIWCASNLSDPSEDGKEFVLTEQELL